jgi:hypothetical protein
MADTLISYGRDELDKVTGIVDNVSASLEGATRAIADKRRRLDEAERIISTASDEVRAARVEQEREGAKLADLTESMMHDNFGEFWLKLGGIITAVGLLGNRVHEKAVFEPWVRDLLGSDAVGTKRTRSPPTKDDDDDDEVSVSVLACRRCAGAAPEASAPGKGSQQGEGFQ